MSESWKFWWKNKSSNQEKKRKEKKRKEKKRKDYANKVSPVCVN